MSWMKKSLAVALLIFSGCASAPPTAKTPQVIQVHEGDSPDYLLKNDAEIFKTLPSQDVGYVVYDLETGKNVATQQANESFVPASVQKIATGTFALDVLGPKYRFKTRLLYEDGVLYLQGGGDPFLTAADLMKLALELKTFLKTGKVREFHYDQSLLPTSPWISNQRSFGEDSYNPGVSALSLDFNESSVGEAGTDQLVRIFSVPDFPDTEALFPGTAPVRDPGRFTARVFAKFCGMIGVILPPPSEENAPHEARAIATHQSFELAKLVEMNLEYSNNLMSELILLSAGRKIAGHAVTQKEAANLLVTWLKKKSPTTDWKSYQIENGSGLTSQAQVSPEQELAILKLAEPNFALLPIAGWKGSLKRRLGDPHLAFRVWAKTGTVNFSSALAGYFFSASNHKYAFVIFITDRDLRHQLDAGKTATPGAVDAWIKNAHDVQDALLARWVASANFSTNF
jgi:serine-type D-Ala-D-Ala carboxypeptidase/endopeptidase (penicillin-binding protein 4)